MAKPELGTKHVCVSCAAKFYDLGKQPAVCPKCDTEQPVEQPRVRRPVGNVTEEKRRPKPAPAAGQDDADTEAETTSDDDDDDDESDEDVLEDTSDLEDGAEVAVKPERNEEDR